MKKIENEYIHPYSVKFIFAWYDLWVGLYIDRKNKLIYFFPLPTLGVRYKYGYLSFTKK